MNEKIEVRITLHDLLKDKIVKNIHEFSGMKIALDFINSLSSLENSRLIEAHIITVYAGYVVL